MSQLFNAECILYDSRTNMIDNMSYYVMLNNSVRIFNIEINSCPASSQCIGGRLIIIFTLILTNTQ